MVEACVKKQTGSIKNTTTEGTKTITGKCDEQKCRQKVLHEFFVKKGDDSQLGPSAHLTKDNETESIFNLNRYEQKPSASSQPGEHVWSVTYLATKAEIIAHCSLLLKIYHLDVLKTELHVTRNSFQIHLFQKKLQLDLPRCHI